MMLLFLCPYILEKLKDLKKLEKLKDLKELEKLKKLSLPAVVRS